MTIQHHTVSILLGSLLGPMIFLLGPPVCALSTPDEPATIVLLQVATNPGQRLIEKQFETQLRLSLSKFTIQTIDKSNDFAKEPLTERLGLIKKLAAENNASATIWLDQNRANLTFLNLVSLSTGHAMMRIVEAAKGPEVVLELTLATQELIGQAYLLDSGPRPVAVDDAVNDVTQKAIRKEAAAKTPSRFSLGLYGASMGPMPRTKDAMQLFGGGVAAGVWGTEQLVFLFQMSVLSTSPHRKDWGIIHRTIVAPALGIGYMWRWPHMSIGPQIAMHLQRTQSNIHPHAGNSVSAITWSPCTSLQLFFRIAVSDSSALVFIPGVQIALKKDIVTSSPGEETLYTSSQWGWTALIGLETRL